MIFRFFFFVNDLSGFCFITKTADLMAGNSTFYLKVPS